MTKIKAIPYLVNKLGLRIILLRLYIYANKLTGISRKRFVSRPWTQITLQQILAQGIPTELEDYACYRDEHVPSFLLPMGKPPAVPGTTTGVRSSCSLPLADRGELLEQMRCVYFGEQSSPERIDWHHDPFHGGRSNPDPIWCDIPCYLPEQGDPRMLWEPSRAAWAIDIARIAARGEHPDAADLLWKWIDDWMEHCPPFHGFQWWCGQETAVRFIALTIGIWACSKKLTPLQWQKFVRLAWATGYRIVHHINYAISQKNDHALSEAVGLMMIGHLFPELRESSIWSKKGKKVLSGELIRQCYSDGSYLQQSHNYHRVMLQNAILGVRLAEIAGEPFPQELYTIIDQSASFLFQMIDPDTGKIPLYGNNDGAHILPLSECDFLDFRPVVQAAHYLVHRKRLFAEGPWDEDCLWLTGEIPPTQDAERIPEPMSSRFDEGGYYTLRRSNEKTWAMIRCHTYKDRQGHRDALHVDLWWRGINILRDCGTYQYYIPGRPDMEDYFSSMSAHNTVQVDGSDALEKVSRFLVFPWGRATVRHFSDNDSVAYFEGESFDYDRSPWNVLHRRAVLSLYRGIWVIIDDLLGHGEHSARWWWHLAEGDIRLYEKEEKLELETAAGLIGITMRSSQGVGAMQLICGSTETDQVQGVAAPSYGRLDDVAVLQADYCCTLPLRTVTVISPTETAYVSRSSEEKKREKWDIRCADRSVTIKLNQLARDADSILSSIDQ